VALSAFVPICVGASSAEVERHMQTYRETNPQNMRMMDSLATWLSGTPAEVRAQLEALSEAGIARVMVSVNCDLHRQMLPLLAEAV
jgi:alkanesulfonate monooxygenase SsuD/methylene tetrahydromethanopterin reductase-like flavin-dependent oxidoreductase (luciferase family)